LAARPPPDGVAEQVGKGFPIVPAVPPFPSPALLPRPAPILLPALLLGILLVPAALAMPQGSQVPLECRLGDGPWQDCHMQIESIGMHWWLLIGEQRVEFRHDGRGRVTMQEREGGGWRPVDSRWAEDTSLCWNGICAKGDIPLD
jgi:hypothetical protein